MIKKYIIHFWYVLYFIFAPCANAQSLSPDMRALCDRADNSKFIPLPESISAPHTDPLFHAIEMGAGYESTKSLLAERSPDKIVIHGMTPLVAAAYVGNWPAARALIESNADVNLKRPDVLSTPLMAALFKSKYPVACKLIENKAKLPESKEDKDSLFLEAHVATPRSLDKDAAIFVEHLLTHGFSANDMGSSLETPLMGAVALHNIPVIKVLLKHGARLDILTKDGRTVWTVAYEKNNPRVIKLLKDAEKKADGTKRSESKELVR